MFTTYTIPSLKSCHVAGIVPYDTTPDHCYSMRCLPGIQQLGVSGSIVKQAPSYSAVSWPVVGGPSCRMFIGG